MSTNVFHSGLGNFLVYVLLQVFNYLSTRRKSVHDLAAFVRSVVKGGTPRKQWSMIAQLPGEVYGEGEERKPNLIAYQVIVK